MKCVKCGEDLRNTLERFDAVVVLRITPIRDIGIRNGELFIDMNIDDAVDIDEDYVENGGFRCVECDTEYTYDELFEMMKGEVK